jgi:DNA-binding MarR family transcriptional regulator
MKASFSGNVQKIRNDEVALCRSIHLFHATLLESIERELVSVGLPLRYKQFLVLDHLATHGSTSAHEIAKSAYVIGGGITRILDELTDMGLLRRMADASDRRALCIVLTKEGLQRWSRACTIVKNAILGATRALKPFERQRMSGYLQQTLKGSQHG